VNLGVATPTLRAFGITRGNYLAQRTLGVERITTGVQELLVLLIAFALPMAVAAWVLRR
jgi:hypothetical protein